MILVFYLLTLLGLLVGFLIWRKIPRRYAFETANLSVWVFVLSSYASLKVVGDFAPKLQDGLVPFLPPVIPVVFFVAWALRRLKALQEAQRQADANRPS
jgi:hypothetical protein